MTTPTEQPAKAERLLRSLADLPCCHIERGEGIFHLVRVTGVEVLNRWQTVKFA
jgi:hypothetical protein